MKFKDSLRQAMSDADMKVKNLSELSGVSTATIYGLLKGKSCKLSNFVAIGKVLPAIVDDIDKWTFEDNE